MGSFLMLEFWIRLWVCLKSVSNMVILLFLFSIPFLNYWDWATCFLLIIFYYSLPQLGKKSVIYYSCLLYLQINLFYNLSPLFIFSPNDSPSKIRKVLFILSKKLFLFSRYSNFCIFLAFFPNFSNSKLQTKVYDALNWLS